MKDLGAEVLLDCRATASPSFFRFRSVLEGVCTAGDPVVHAPGDPQVTTWHKMRLEAGMRQRRRDERASVRQGLDDLDLSATTGRDRRDDESRMVIFDTEI